MKELRYLMEEAESCSYSVMKLPNGWFWATIQGIWDGQSFSHDIERQTIDLLMNNMNDVAKDVMK